jgi:hypothetical protein
LRDVMVSAGAGFVVVLTGDIMTMPGLPKVPAAESIDIDENGQTVAKMRAAQTNADATTATPVRRSIGSNFRDISLRPRRVYGLVFRRRRLYARYSGFDRRFP